MDRKKLEARVARLEKLLLKNEAAASVSGLVRQLIDELQNDYIQSPAVVKAQVLLKRIPAAHSRDKVNGTDRAYDLANEVLDVLYNRHDENSMSREFFGRVDDLISLIN